GYCGDGIVAVDEACDDGNELSDDGCTSCSNDAGWLCSGAPSVCFSLHPSCTGMDGTECQGADCCASPSVPSGTFEQGEPDAFSSAVSAFELDKYEVTVGRFRNFVAAYDAWRSAGEPRAGAGSNP